MLDEDFQLLLKFRKEYNRFPRRCDMYDGVKIGEKFVRLKNEKIELTEIQHKTLSEYGCEIDSDIIEKNTMLVVEFYNLNGRLPLNDEVVDNINIGNFFRGLRNYWTKSTVKVRELLKKNNIILISDEVYEKNHELVLELIKMYKKLNRLPTNEESEKNLKLYTFAKKVESTPMCVTYEDLLLLKNENVDLTFNLSSMRTHNKIMLLKMYYDEFNCEPDITAEYNGEKVGLFLNRIRLGLINVRSEDEKKLRELGFDLSKSKCRRNIDMCFKLLIEFFEKFKRRPSAQEVYDGIKIGKFYNNIRYGKIKVPQEYAKILEENGCFIGNDMYVMHKYVELIVEYYQNFGIYPDKNTVYKNVRLGEAFILVQKKSKTTKKVSFKDKKILEKIGIYN